MAVEIGKLVVRGIFGPDRPDGPPAPDAETLELQMELLRRDILNDVREMLAEAERRARER